MRPFQCVALSILVPCCASMQHHALSGGLIQTWTIDGHCALGAMDKQQSLMLDSYINHYIWPPSACSAGHHGKGHLASRKQPLHSFYCEKCICGKDGFETKTLVLFKTRVKLKLQHMCKARCLENAIIIENGVGKGRIFKGYAFKKRAA